MLLNDVRTLLITVQLQLSMYNGCRRVYLDRHEVLVYVFLFVNVCSISNTTSIRHSQPDARNIFIACFQYVLQNICTTLAL